MLLNARTLLIMGPTASGKSALALALAEELGAEIVNADSKQVYAHLRVLTARPSPEDEARAPHHLYGFVDETEAYSAGRWATQAAAAIADIHARGRTALVVGGTGLYFKALTHGLAPAPSGSPVLRARLREELACEGAASLHERLAAIDPARAAALAPADAVRILRALELAEIAEQSPTELRARAAPLLAPGAWAGIALAPPRDALYAAIGTRFAAMLEEGALDEARAIAARALDPELPAMKAHGLPWLIRHLAGEMSLEEAAGFAVRDTRRYAKRQMTWIAGQMADWPRLAEIGLEARRLAAKTALSG